MHTQLFHLDIIHIENLGGDIDKFLIKEPLSDVPPGALWEENQVFVG